MAKLSEPEILDRMPEAKGWERHGDMLVRSWQFPSFRRAWSSSTRPPRWPRSTTITPTSS